MEKLVICRIISGTEIMTSPVVNQLPAFSDSISQPALPTEISGLTDFDILGAGVADLTNSIDLDLTTELDLGTELETTLLPDANDNVLASGNLGDLDLGLADLNMVTSINNRPRVFDRKKIFFYLLIFH